MFYGSLNERGIGEISSAFWICAVICLLPLLLFVSFKKVRPKERYDDVTMGPLRKLQEIANDAQDQIEAEQKLQKLQKNKQNDAKPECMFYCISQLLINLIGFEL